MKIYLVGGAVRDRLLGLPVRERDWVVVGATVQAMLDLGYRQVGKSFPVFLHPQTQEEYALARTERKTGPGYTGFEVHASPEVSLEEDLLRRDLTINAMAEDEQGNIIDPFGGRDDLNKRLLRHVSPAFSEDPVRILRAARFAARFGELDFHLSHATNALMRSMVAAGEVDALVPERVWQETEKSLAEAVPRRFWEVLRGCGALAVIFPELDCLFGVPQPAQHHPEVDTGIHSLNALDQAARLTPDPQVRFAALVHDLGKGLTPPQEWPRHLRHEQNGLEPVRQLCKRLKVPAEFRDLALLVTRYHLDCMRIGEMRTATIVDLLDKLDVWRRPQRLQQFLLACEADARGRDGFEDRPFVQRAQLQRIVAAARSVDAASLAAGGLKGEAMREALRRARINAVGKVIREQD